MKVFLYLLAMISVILPNSAQADLILLAAPRSDDPYYSKVTKGIFNFHIKFSKKILESGDDFLILTDKQAYVRYAAVLGKRRVIIEPISDIWMRDFGTSNAASPVMFRYTAAGQGGNRKGQKHADEVQKELARFAEQAGLVFKESHLFNDGGNFVDDYSGNVVVSRKFLRDNKLSEQVARRKLKKLDNIRNVAFIEADEQGGLEHADGVVSFVDNNTLIINSYPLDPAYVRQLKEDLRRGLPGVTIHEIITAYDGSKIYDDRFGSACGLYTNALVTPKRIYLPQFGIPEDSVALAQVKAITNREVVPVDSSDVCFMGGGVRCMSWQLRGKNVKRLRLYLQSIVTEKTK